MIIGHGIIANTLKDREDRVFFASGVSNSQETRESEYQREIDLLMKQDFDKHIVYFSTLSIFFTESRYTQHKKHMESLIKRHFKHYTILRLGNPSWKGGPDWHLVNFFRKKIKNKEPFEVRDVYRFLVSKDDFLFWVDKIPSFNCEINISGERVTAQEIVDRIKKGLI